MSSTSTLNLYRSLLKHAARFPSIKRQKIVDEIKLSFRENRSLIDQAEISKHLDIANKGLEQLSQYTMLNKRSANWEVSLEKQPMPSSK